MGFMWSKLETCFPNTAPPVSLTSGWSEALVGKASGLSWDDLGTIIRIGFQSGVTYRYLRPLYKSIQGMNCSAWHCLGFLTSVNYY